MTISLYKIKRVIDNSSITRSNHSLLYGRGERIRTSDILLPKQARYQAALRPANKTKMLNITHGYKNQEF